MRRPPAAVWVVLLACCGIAACSGSGSSGTTTSAATAPPAEADAKPAAEEAIAVEVGTVEREPLSSVYSTSATLRADKKATVTARTRGVVRQILVEEGASVDAVSREVIERAGYGERFVHSLGHGVGLEIHEAPSLGRKQDEPLPAGAVVTVEPGIYIPGLGGVRIEDMVEVTDDGCVVVGTSTRDLIEL